MTLLCVGVFPCRRPREAGTRSRTDCVRRAAVPLFGLGWSEKLHGCNGTYLIVFLMILIFLTARFNGQVLTTNVSVIQLNDVAVR